MDTERESNLNDIRRLVFIFTRGLLQEYGDPAVISTALVNHGARLSLQCSDDGHKVTRVLLNALLDEYLIHNAQAEDGTEDGPEDCAKASSEDLENADLLSSEEEIH